jgi:hypothetical protein
VRARGIHEDRYLVYLVCLVCLVSLGQATKQTR